MRRGLVLLLLARHAARALIAPRAPALAPRAARSAAAAAGLHMKIQRRASGRAARSEAGGIAAVARTTQRAGSASASALSRLRVHSS